MSDYLDGGALVYCEGAFNTTNGKTAHGLVRRTRRYRVHAVIDSRHVGRDAGTVLDGWAAGIPIVADLQTALAGLQGADPPVQCFVVGLAPDGGRLPPAARAAVAGALQAGLHVDCGLHDFLSEDPEFAALAAQHGARIRDIRRPPPRDQLHFFQGVIDDVTATRIAVLGTDSAVGKRTTAWLLVDALTASGTTAELIGTGQTAWLQGARYGIILDSLVNDFISGEIEHVIWRCWQETGAAALVLEGQGSLLNPAYPGGFELLAAGRPQAVVLQHAPARRTYDGFPRSPLHPLERQIEAIQLISGVPVVAITVNHEGLTPSQTRSACQEIEAETGLPAVDPLRDGVATVIAALRPHLRHVEASQ